MATYEVRGNLRCNGREYVPGDSFSVDESGITPQQLARLLELQVISPVIIASPPKPVAEASVARTRRKRGR